MKAGAQPPEAEHLGQLRVLQGSSQPLPSCCVAWDLQQHWPCPRPWAPLAGVLLQLWHWDPKLFACLTLSQGMQTPIQGARIGMLAQSTP